MTLLLRAIITGFGLKLGSELGRLVAERLGISKSKDDTATNEEPVPPGGLLDDTPAPASEGRRTKSEQTPAEPTLVVEPSPTIGD